MKITVLDHGYVEFIEAWGSGSQGITLTGDNRIPARWDFEVGIIEAARQSTQGSFRGWEEKECIDEGCPQYNKLHSHSDAALLSYLYKNRHETPFEFAGMVIEVQAPLFVFREWHRHRTQSYNEMSARYEPLPDLYYIPDSGALYDRIQLAKGSSNRQSQATRGSVIVEELLETKVWCDKLHQYYVDAEKFYRRSLRDGMPKEVARLSMPVGHYSRMRASANLRNWLSFMTLRCDDKAQWEIRQFATAVSNIIEEKFPQTYGLWFNQFKRDTVTLC